MPENGEKDKEQNSLKKKITKGYKNEDVVPPSKVMGSQSDSNSDKINHDLYAEFGKSSEFKS